MKTSLLRAAYAAFALISSLAAFVPATVQAWEIGPNMRYWAQCTYGGCDKMTGYVDPGPYGWYAPMHESLSAVEELVDRSYIEKDGFDRYAGDPDWRYRCGPATTRIIKPVFGFEPPAWWGAVEWTHSDCHLINTATGERQPLEDYVWSVATRGDCDVGFQFNYNTGSCFPTGATPLDELNSDLAPAGCNPSNPIHSALGTKVQRETDYVLDGGFALERTYMSMGSRSTGRFGWGWRNPMDRHFLPYFSGASTSPGRLWIRFGSGDALTAIRSSTDGWELESVKKDVLVRDAVVDGEPGIEIVDGRRGIARYTIQGQLRQWQAMGAQPFTYIYDSDRRVVAVRSAQRRELRFEYGFKNEPLTVSSAERRNAITAVVLPDGRRIEYLYENVDLSEPMHRPLLRGVTVAKVNRLVGVRFPDGRVRRYHYEAQPAPVVSMGTGYDVVVNRPYLLTGITDEREMRFATWQYNSDNRATLSVHGPENGTIDRVTLDFVQPGHKTLITDALGNTRAFMYEQGPIQGEIKLTSLSGPSALCGNRFKSLGYEWASGNLTTAIDFNNRQHTFDHDDRGRQTRHTESVGTPDERTTETDWHAVFSVPVEERIKNAAGTVVQRTVYTHDALGNVLSVTASDPVAGTSRALTATRDAEGRLLTVDGPRIDVSDLTTYTYFDAEDPACASAPTTCAYRRGDLKSVTNALGHTTHFVRYDGAGRLLESRDANGLVSTFTYTPRGWLASRTSGGLTTSITYTAVGDVQTVTTPDGRSLTYTYDVARRLTAVQDQRGHRIEWTLDNAGNRLAENVKDAGGTLRRTLTQQFNTLGRLSQAANAAGQATLFTQDANGNLDLASDPLNRTTDQDVDALDRVTKQLQDVAGLNVSTQFGFDALDQLTTVTDPKGLITRYTNDGLGNLLRLESPDTGTTTYTVDAAGNRRSQTDARGITVNYAYDALNRLTGISFPTAALNTTFVYDSAGTCPAGETFALGRLSAMTDASGSTRWCYDQLGRLTRKVQVTNGRTFTTAYAYDAQGRLSTQTLPSGAQVKFGYATGEVNTVAVRLPGSSVDLPLINGIERLPFGPVSKLTYGNGRTQTRAFDLDYAIDRITSSEASGWTQDYGVDAVGNLTSILGTGSNNRFRYDGLDRLTHADNTSNVTQRQYPVDKTGNRTSKKTSASGAVVPYTYEGTSHRLTSNGTDARTYDAVGNPISIGARTLTYDERSRLTVFVNGSTTRRYQYTGQGLRVRKWTSSNTSGNTYFVYNENAQLIGEYNNAGARTQEIIWLGNLPIGVIAGTAAAPVLHYIESDHLGTPRVIVDATRNVGIWRWNQTNDPFGESVPNQNPDGDATSVTFNLRFAGQYRDAESGYFYNVNRMYDPTIGRYLESDPIGLGGGISTYSYVGAAPLTAVDPLGLAKVVLFDPNAPVGSNDRILLDRANEYQDRPGHCLVYAHGNAGRIFDQRSGESVSLRNPDEVWQALQSAGCQENEPVTLYVCRTGEGEINIASSYANERGVTVTAPDKYVFYDQNPNGNGPTIVAGKDPANPQRHNPADPGRFVEFPPQPQVE
jgi:RHS repeat-associated protein